LLRYQEEISQLKDRLKVLYNLRQNNNGQLNDIENGELIKKLDQYFQLTMQLETMKSE
ncbi:unnamed protein product, partial [Didymodactylos carnosus]